MHWIIGDIHGMLHPLEKLLEAVQRHDDRPRFVFVGDYINRGPDSKAVIDLLLTLDDARFLRGNHDDVFDEILHGNSYCKDASQADRIVAFRYFLQHGLDNTLLSYGVDWAEIEYLAEHPDEERLVDLMMCVPEHHRQFVRQLQPVYETGELFVGHGKWDPDEHDMRPAMSQQLTGSMRLRQNLLWGRFIAGQVTQRKTWNRVGYFGHTPVENYPHLLSEDEQYRPIVAPNMVLVDTGAALSPIGRLTAYCHETQSFLQTNHFGFVITPKVAKGESRVSG